MSQLNSDVIDTVRGLGISGRRGKTGRTGPMGVQADIGRDGFNGYLGVQGFRGNPAETHYTQNTYYVDGTYGGILPIVEQNLTVIHHFRLGDDDDVTAGTVLITGNTTIDIEGGADMTVNVLDDTSYATYSSDVPSSFPDGSLSIDFSPTSPGRVDRLENLQNPPDIIDNFCVEAWVKPRTTTATANGSEVVFRYGKSQFSGNGFGLQISRSGNGWAFDGANVGALESANNTLDLNTWQHIAITRDLSKNNYGTIYKNGVIIAGPSPTTPSSVASPTERISIAGTNNPDNDIRFKGSFDGLIAEVRMFTFTAGTFERGMLSFFNNYQPILTNILSPFKYIQDAINTASSGDKIIIQRGIYEETIVIDKDLTFNFKGSTLGSVNLVGSIITINNGAKVWIKGYPTIEGPSEAINISEGSMLYGKFKDINQKITTNDTGTIVDIDFRDINSAGITFESTDTTLRLRGRDMESVTSTSRVLDLNNSEALLKVRDLSSTSSSTARLYLENNSQCDIIFRDTSASFCCNGRSIEVQSGNLIAFCRKLERSNRGLWNIYVANGSANIKVMTMALIEQSPSFASVYIGPDGNINLSCYYIDEGNINARWLFHSVSSGNNLIKLNIQKVLCRSGNVFVNHTGTGETILDIDVTSLNPRFDDRTQETQINGHVTGNYSGFRLQESADGINSRDYDICEFNQLDKPFLFNWSTIIRPTTDVDTLFDIDGVNGMDLVLRIHKARGATDEITDLNLETEERTTGLIVMRGAGGKTTVEIDELENAKGGNGGFCAYMAGDQNSELHFKNCTLKSNSLCIGMEETGTGPADLQVAGKLFFHGSNTLIGNTGSFIGTDSSSFSTINADNGLRSVLINEGRLNMLTNVESTEPKGVAVKEPIAGPEGAKSISFDYSIVH